MKSKLLASLLLTAALGVVLALGGCSASKTDMAALEGSWKLDSFGGTGALVPADPSVVSDLTLKAGQASGSGGVNSFSGTYQASADSKISFGPLAATAMAGPPAAMDQESKYFAALAKVQRYDFNQGNLVLGDAGNNTLLVFVKK
jgi:heat shock protein HslJ